MIEALRDVRARLNDGAYRNEEHVRLNLVTRLLHELGWNIWDPLEVNAEWRAAATEDATKVDLALFVNGYAPSVVIEIKAVGRISASLAAVEKQLRDYNRDNTALFSVITDGQEWRLYFSQTGGDFAQKCFTVVDLVRGDLAEVERTLTMFLSKAEIDIGNAKAEAERYLQLNQRQRVLRDALPAARRLVQEPPYPSLPDSLTALVRSRGITISREEALQYISASTEAFVPAPSAPEPLTQPRAAVRVDPGIEGVMRTLPPDNPGDLRFSLILNGALGSARATRWNELVAGGVRMGLAQGVSLRELQSILTVSIQEGHRSDRGFAPVAGTNVSIRNLDAGKCAQNLVLLARLLRCHLEVRLRWGEGSPYAGQIGVLSVKP